MTPKYLERTKRNVSIILSTVCIIGCVFVYLGKRSAQNDSLNEIDLVLLCACGAAFFSGMPGEFDSLKDKTVWFLAVYGMIPAIMALLILRPWVGMV